MLIDWLHFILFLPNKIRFHITHVKYIVALTVHLALIMCTGLKHYNICLNIVLRLLIIYIENTHGMFLNQSFCFETTRKAELHKFCLMLELTILTIFRANNNIKNLLNLIL